MNLDGKALLAQLKPKQLKSIKTTAQFMTARHSPDGAMLAAGTMTGMIQRFTTKEDAFTEQPALTGHHGFVVGLIFHPDGQRLFSADSWGELRCSNFMGVGTVQWSLPNAHDGWVRQIAISPDGATLASVGMDRRIRIWSTVDGKRLHEIDALEDTYSLIYTGDGKHLVTGDLRGIIREWDIATGKPLRELDAKVLFRYDRIQEVGGVRRLLFSPDGKTLFAAGCQPSSGGFVQGVPTLLRYDWATGKALQTLKFGGDADGFIHDLLWHPSGCLAMVTSGQPGNGNLLLLVPGEETAFLTTRIGNCHAVSLALDRKRLIVMATNGGSSGNGRLNSKNEADYPANHSPIVVWQLEG